MFTKVHDLTDEHYEEWQAVEQFGKDKYYLGFVIDSDKIFVSLSSGNKRKHKSIFEEKEYKPKGGFQALIWARNTILEFTNFKKIKYTILGWADSRRKKIYKRGLCKYGFREGRVHGAPCLIRKNYE